MKIFITFLLFYSFTIAQQNVAITFTVYGKVPKEADKIYITGNHSLLGNWNPSRIPLKKENDTTWFKKIYFFKGDTIQFKFTRGNWTSEEITADGSIRENYFHVVAGEENLTFNIARWRDEKNLTAGKITGKIVTHRSFSYEGLLSRDVQVWLPPDYDPNSETRYPVIYMHDGQNLFDVVTASFGIEWNVDETSDSLIRNNFVQSFIVVGIYNTVNREDEYSQHTKGELYRDFVSKKLKPFIDKTYKTLPDAPHTYTFGSSAGATVSFLLAWSSPEIFGTAICFSPAFMYEKYNINLIKLVKDHAGEKKNLKFYFYNGGDGLDSQLQFGLEDMIKNLKLKGYSENKDFYLFVDRNGKHHESTWAQHFWRPLLQFLGN